MPVFTHARIIAYQVPTVWWKAGGPMACATNPGDDCGTSTRINPGTGDDAKKRLLRLASAVNRAKTRVDAMKAAGQDGPEVLKIFTVPEFYFRPNFTNQEGVYAYTPKDYIDIAKSLNNLFPKSEFEDWVIVCGTIVWDGGKGIYNDSITVIGAEEQASRLRNVSKLMDSAIDGIPLPDVPVKPVSPIPCSLAVYTDYVRKLESWNKVTLTYLKFKSFTKNARFLQEHLLLDGRLGVEICLEHTLKTLRQAVEDHAPMSRKKGVDVHILIAGGMPMSEYSMAAREGGVVARNDGMSHATANPVELCTVEGLYDTAMTPVDTPSYTQKVLAYHGANHVHVHKQVFLSGVPEYLPAPMGYVNFEQGIKIFDKVALS